MIKLGDLARDTITGFTGVVVAETKWLHGCIRLTLQPKALKDGKPIDNVTFDLPQLELIPAVRQPSTSGTGGPQPEPSRASDPR